MKKKLFYFLATILMFVIFASVIGLMFTGKGLLMYGKVEKMADANTDNIKVVEREVPTGKAMLEYDPRSIDENTFNHIYVDGIKCDFPLKLNELPEAFTWSVRSVAINGDSEGINDNYAYKVNLYYNDVLWACGYYYHETDSYFPDDIVITTLLLYANEGTEYVPEVIAGGFDVKNADIKSVNKAFGYASEEFGYQCFYSPSQDENYSYRLYVGIANNGVGISRLEYLNRPYEVEADVEFEY